MANLKRVKIIVSGLVQGVGFRYFVVRNTEELNLKGFTQNLYSGEVLTIAEGDEKVLKLFLEKVKVGPQHAHVKSFRIEWQDYINEFSEFEVRR